MLAGCGGSQPSIGTPGAMPQTSALATHAGRGKSWMARGTSSGDLLYATQEGSTYVFSYPTGALLTTLSNGGSAICSDSVGDVFITDDEIVYEYAHGATKPIATLALPGKFAQGCAVDPLTNNLAVVFQSSAGDIAVFANEQGKPTTYASHIDSLFCGFDNSGNLFVDGFSGPNPALAELPQGSGTFVPLSISQAVGLPGQVQWDGNYVTYEGISPQNTTISRLAISGSAATIVSTITFKGIKRRAYESWLYNGNAIIPFATHGAAAKRIGFWKYPKGGQKTKSVPHFSTKHTWIIGVTISVGS